MKRYQLDYFVSVSHGQRFVGTKKKCLRLQRGTQKRPNRGTSNQFNRSR